MNEQVIEIVKQKKVASAHRLPYQGFKEGAGKGKCTRLHGHTYVVEIGVRGPVRRIKEDDPESGMVADFGRLGEFLNWLHDQIMDHHYLNETMIEYPTAENMVLFILTEAKRRLEPTLPPGVKVSLVRVYEEYVDPKSWAEWRG